MFVVSGKPAETPRKAFEVQKVFAFAPPHILCSLCCVWHLPPTDKLLDFLLFFFVFFFFWIFSNTSICILNMSRKWLPSQLLSLCLADKQGMSVYVTQTPRRRYHHAACVTRCRSTNGGVVEKTEASRVVFFFFLNSDKLCSGSLSRYV